MTYVTALASRGQIPRFQTEDSTDKQTFPKDCFNCVSCLTGSQHSNVLKFKQLTVNPRRRLLDQGACRVQGSLASCGYAKSNDVLSSRPWSQRAMLTSNDYKELAARCSELASESSEPTVTEALRALASDYLVRAAQLRHQTTVKRRLSSGSPPSSLGSEEQMFGADEQVRGKGHSD
jgi:hypothetical protein